MVIFKKLAQLFKPSARDGLVHAGKFDGHNIYYYDQIERLPARRYLYFLTNTQEAELGVQRTDIKKFIEGIREAVKVNDQTRIGWFVETLDFYLESFAPEKMLFKTGATLLLMDNENPLQVEDKWVKLKAELFDTNPDFKVFFCKITFQVLKKYGMLSKDTNEEGYLAAAFQESKKERMYSELTGRRIYWDYLSE